MAFSYSRLLIQAAPRLMSARASRIEANGLVVIGNGFVVFVLVDPSGPRLSEPGVFRIEADGFVVIGDGFVYSFLSLQAQPAMVVLESRYETKRDDMNPHPMPRMSTTPVSALAQPGEPGTAATSGT